MALGKYFSDLWAREGQPGTELDDNQKRLIAEAFPGPFEYGGDFIDPVCARGIKTL